MLEFLLERVARVLVEEAQLVVLGIEVDQHQRHDVRMVQLPKARYRPATAPEVDPGSPQVQVHSLTAPQALLADLRPRAAC